jgi:hypothetical protein
MPSISAVRGWTLAVLCGSQMSAAWAGGLVFTPSSLNFGFVALTESKTLSATLSNASSQTASLAGMALQGSNAADFRYASACGKTLAAGASCTVSVTFTTPGTLGPRSAQLLVSSTDPTQPSLALPLKSNPYPALNDSGITRCGDDTQNGLACPVSGYPRQDAEYGRDKYKNNGADGRAGFSYTKLDGNGKPLPASATQWNCVRDNVTGLIWEAKFKGDGIAGNQGLHDGDDRFSWYSSDSGNNGGTAGYKDPGAVCSGYKTGQSSTFCNGEAFAARVNGKGWCGLKNWRLPSRSELLGLVDRSIAYPGPTVDKNYFPDTGKTWYWTATPSADNSDYAWYVSFYSGYAHHYNSRHNPQAVRLVSGAQ